jgi:hypothetical protein
MRLCAPVRESPLGALEPAAAHSGPGGADGEGEHACGAVRCGKVGAMWVAIAENLSTVPRDPETQRSLDAWCAFGLLAQPW